MYAELSWESMGNDLILQNNSDFNRDEFNDFLKISHKKMAALHDISDFNNAEIDEFQRWYAYQNFLTNGSGLQFLRHK